jgi:hypothetical protein
LSTKIIVARAKKYLDIARGAPTKKNAFRGWHVARRLSTIIVGDRRKYFSRAD